MPIERILTLAEELISTRSVTGQEPLAMECMERHLIARGWKTERLPVDGERFNLFASVGAPRIVFTTHLDVVPAPDFLFSPERRDGKLYGRGSCDAKGIAAVMVESATALRDGGAQDVALLFVVDEERTSLGAKSAAPFLKERGVEYIVDGEPTDCALVTGHKGVLLVDLRFPGRSCHSGYPELGDDANAKMIRALAKLLVADFGESAVFGKSTINLGVVRGGVAPNVVSPAAEVTASVRIVTSCAEVVEKLRAEVEDAGEVIVRGASEPVLMKVVPGFETKAVAYGTDVPYLLKSGAECLLYGPGSITVAHTDEEHVPISELEAAFLGYQRIYRTL